MFIETRTREQAYILEVQGEIDLYSSPMLRKYIFNTLKEQKPQTLIVDLSGVTYTDSSGIATLVEGLQLAEEYRTHFKLVGLSQTVLEVFQLVRLERVFDIYDTEDDALQETP
ncbi:anti-anti-sigma factor [candidate division KSB3 bacterium]|uniref:Anti-sigma factor antagonist n=1 Tax=candidate division KSB3 bacterium TaxID=2044937 RepID=A0A2G6KC11_9BACT|nr:MAG: anti-anti-sigma factor [candidate division KSB3 bacterium]